MNVKINQELLEALKLALPYVQGRYECAFPDERENESVQRAVEDAIAHAEKVSVND